MLPDDFEIKKIMIKEFYYDRNNFGGCYGQRHHSIPCGEDLVVISLGNFDEDYHQDKKIIWTIPKRFVPFYKKELENGNNRIINLEKSPDCDITINERAK